MAKTQTGPRVLTGNRLSDGRVVFLNADGEWDASIAAARVARADDEATSLERIGAAAKAANLIVDPYLVEVTEEADGLVPARLRERFRIGGPTVGHSLAETAKERSEGIGPAKDSAVMPVLDTGIHGHRRGACRPGLPGQARQ